jgi:hypothetical protein
MGIFDKAGFNPLPNVLSTSLSSSIDQSLALPGGINGGASSPISNNNQAVDIRARIKVKPSQMSALNAPQKQLTGSRASDPQQIVLGPRDDPNNILKPLYETLGLMFPITPTVSTSSTAEYEQLSFTHSNYDQQSYAKTTIASISLDGQFPAQTEDEARYLIACIHFLRTVTKMYFGQSGGKTGSPPPVLLFNYLGNMFNDVPVVVTDFATNFPKDVDLINVKYADGIISVPVLMNLNVTLKTQYNPYKMKNEFNLDEFRTGKMLKRGYI